MKADELKKRSREWMTRYMENNKSYDKTKADVK